MMLGLAQAKNCWADLPWHCSIWAYSDACNEAFDLRRACEKGMYPDPPRPQAPPVPAGGYSGAATDPDAVHDVVSRSADTYQQDLTDFFSRVSYGLDFEDAEAEAEKKKTASQWAFLALAGVVFLILRR